MVLPQSITQEAEDESFRRRFGTEEAIDFERRHNNVHLMQSGGASGPDIRRRGAAVLVVLLLLAAAAYVVHTQIGFEALLQKLKGG